MGASVLGELEKWGAGVLGSRFSGFGSRQFNGLGVRVWGFGCGCQAEVRGLLRFIISTE